MKFSPREHYSFGKPRPPGLAHKVAFAHTLRRQLYAEWYSYLAWEMEVLPSGMKIEIGSGDGFFKEFAPSVICSDIEPFPGNDLTFSGLDMPFNAESVSGIFMIDTFSHIPDSLALLTEIDRVLMPGGKVIMIEPAGSRWGRLAHRWLGRRMFRFRKNSFAPLSDHGSNAARPWMVFQRDYGELHEKFPKLTVESIHYHTPLRHLLSGWPLLKSVTGQEAHRMLCAVDAWLANRSWHFSMFMTVVIQKSPDGQDQ